ncbi:MAG: 50S ribosomal protein L25 [Chloroflexota bacterium]|nr:50S ribosomal protein L25 [Chloroflexota bacterium]
MAETLVQEIENRTAMGKKVKALRRVGMIPANIFGRGTESKAIQLNTHEAESILVKAGGTQMITLKNPSTQEDCMVLVKGVQRDPISGKLFHVDFYRVRMEDKIKVEVPLIFGDDAPASQRKDLVLLENMYSVEVECMPVDIPENISVDMSKLAEAGDHVLVGDLSISEKLTILTNPDDVIARVSVVKQVAEEEEDEGEVTEAGAESSGEAPAELGG